MLHNSKEKEELFREKYDVPLFGTTESNTGLAKNVMSEEPISGALAYRLIRDELMDEGNARQNLATFCQTFMEDEAVKLMSETLEKNAIDKTEYPETSEIESRCVNMIADLWNNPSDKKCVGTSTVGSSEACMLAGMAMKFRWRNLRKKLGLPESHKPNLIISSAYQVCWEKFCVYWDVELRTMPITADCLKLDAGKLTDYIDENTIGVVGILGITYTGCYDDIAAIDAVLTQYNKSAKLPVYIHVDAASGGFFAPFVNPEIAWDFRLDNVISINSSGHKYGLVYPGIGWVLWKEKEYIPDELIFKVDYLGGSMPTMAINFSRSASSIIGQYYNFLRLGKVGYRQIHIHTREMAMYISDEIERTGYFMMVHAAKDLPIICYKLNPERKTAWNLYDLSDRLRMNGWQVPTYPLPPSLTDTIIQRIVCRQDMTKDMAENFIRDLKAAIEQLDKARILMHDTKEDSKEVNKVYGFTH